MTPRARARLWVQPLGSSLRLALYGHRKTPGIRVAEIDNTGYATTGDNNYGWLVHLANGNYVIEQVNGALRTVDQRKAAAAHQWVVRARDAKTN